MLTEPIKGKWFDMMLEPDKDKRKLDEYRTYNDYWGKRFATVLGYRSREELDAYLLKHGESDEFEVMYKNGYSKSSPSCITRVKLRIGTGREEWGAEKDTVYYVQRILGVRDVQSTKRMS